MTESIPIDQITIDEETFSVTELPEEIQAAVRKYEEWRDRYVIAQDEVQLVASALRDLGSQIVAGVRQVEEQKAAAEAEAAAEAVTVAKATIESTELPEAPVVPVGETLVVEDNNDNAAS